MAYKAPGDRAPSYLGLCSPTPTPQTYSNVQPHCFVLEPPERQATALVLASRPLPRADQMTPNTLHQIFAGLAPPHSRSMKCRLLGPSPSTVSKMTDLTLHPMCLHGTLSRSEIVLSIHWLFLLKCELHGSVGLPFMCLVHSTIVGTQHTLSMVCVKNYQVSLVAWMREGVTGGENGRQVKVGCKAPRMPP